VNRRLELVIEVEDILSLFSGIRAEFVIVVGIIFVLVTTKIRVESVAEKSLLFFVRAVIVFVVVSSFSITILLLLLIPSKLCLSLYIWRCALSPFDLNVIVFISFFLFYFMLFLFLCL